MTLSLIPTLAAKKVFYLSFHVSIRNSPPISESCVITVKLGAKRFFSNTIEVRSNGFLRGSDPNNSHSPFDSEIFLHHLNRPTTAPTRPHFLANTAPGFAILTENFEYNAIFHNIYLTLNEHSSGACKRCLNITKSKTCRRKWRMAV